MYILLHQRNATSTSWKQIYLRPTEFNCSQRFSSFPGLFCHVPWTQVLKPIRKDGACCKHRFWKVWLLMITCDYSWLDSITFFDGASYCLWTDSSRYTLSNYCCCVSSKKPLPFNPCLSAFVCSTLQASISMGGTTKAQLSDSLICGSQHAFGHVLESKHQLTRHLEAQGTDCAQPNAFAGLKSSPHGCLSTSITHGAVTTRTKTKLIQNPNSKILNPKRIVASRKMWKSPSNCQIRLSLPSLQSSRQGCPSEVLSLPRQRPHWPRPHLRMAFCWLCWSSPEVVEVPPSLELVSLLWVLLVLLALSWVWSVDAAKH